MAHGPDRNFIARRKVTATYCFNCNSLCSQKGLLKKMTYPSHLFLSLMIHEIIIGFWRGLHSTAHFDTIQDRLDFRSENKKLTCFTSGFSGSIHSHFDAFGVDSHLRRTGADGDSQIEALSCKGNNNTKSLENFRP